MILWIQKTKQAGTHPKTTKQPINHTLGQFYAVNVMLYRHTCMNASIIVAALDISLLLKKKKKVHVHVRAPVQARTQYTINNPNLVIRQFKQIINRR